MNFRTATPDDLTAINEIEQVCFLPNQAILCYHLVYISNLFCII